MAVTWTPEQQQVITLRDCSMLVSAAAGSGKTAVLVERIIRRITDATNPVNIDRFVLVTFTRKAAGEMKERIQAAIEKEAALHPENEHLQRQRTRIHMANISTIHGFCTEIIRNHFQEIDLDPAFRMGDEGELKLLRQEVLSDVLEACYEEGNEEFIRFSETFATGKSDEALEAIIIQLHQYAMSFPNPEQWLYNCLESYCVESYEELVHTSWMEFLAGHLKKTMLSMAEISERLSALVYNNPDSDNYRDVADFYAGLVKRLSGTADYRIWYEALRELKHPNLPSGKRACPDVALREEIKVLRESLKEYFTQIQTGYFTRSPEELLEDMRNCRPVMKMLCDVTVCFMEAFRQEKRQKNLLDFNDLEHEALRILIDENGEKTETAREYADFYEEILVDEYQDSNYLQECLLRAVSRQDEGTGNLFMVGDAKQSIYRFRLARPELFMEKFNTYSTEEGAGRRIDLHKNFRSRREVLDACNYIFERIMLEDLGQIRYDKDAALYCGMDFPETEAKPDYRTELLLFDRKDLEADDKEFEAKMIAHRIKKLVSGADELQIVDKRTGAYRKVRYSDIAILLRSTAGFDQVLAKELAAEGIPAHTLSKEGYFQTLEVVTVLNYLKIIDNPMQDIPLLSVLKSPMVAVTDEELAKLRIFRQEDCLYRCLEAYSLEGDDEELKCKMSEFIEQLTQFRQDMYYMPVDAFLCHLLDVTGYGEYVEVMPGGSQRKANLDMLIEKASVFEQTSYTGVFQFVRYMEQLKKYEVDMGEVSTLSEQDDTVRIMTIHASKGLEFPVVFVAGLGKQFNRQDEKNAIALHAQTGIGMDSIYLENRRKSRTLYKKTLVLQNRLETMGEELRVLYVAFTRAKEKLILTAGAKNLEGSIQKAYQQGCRQVPAYTGLTGALGYLDWILAALAGHECLEPLIETYVEEPVLPAIAYESDWRAAQFLVKRVTLQDLMEEDLTQMAENARLEMQLDVEKAKCDTKLPEAVQQALEYRYPYENRAIPVKVSVSELKHAGMVLDEESRHVMEQKEKEPVRPSFMEEKEETVQGSDRGTAYHKVFERLDLSCAKTLEQVQNQLEHLFQKQVLDEKFRSSIRAEKIYRFANSPIGKRLQEAQSRQAVHREQPFVFALPANTIHAEWKEKTPVLIQGIIDVYFEEDGELVLLDYKTDYIRSGNALELVDRYKVQMDYYKMALESLTGKRVKEIVLYSVYLDKAIVL